MTNPLVIGLVVGLVILVILAVYAIVAVSRRSDAKRLRARPSEQTMVGDARLEPGERAASLSAEQIEEMVQRRLRDDPELAGTALDFGTGPEGGLEVWVDGVGYENIEDILDPRIRAAIEDAVDEFNAQG